MQLNIEFPPIFAPKLPLLMEQIHINKVRHLLNNNDIQLVGKTRLEIGKTKIKWLATGKTELIEVTKLLNC
jgi:hypothetical protein